jgi:hypothetical protein
VNAPNGNAVLEAALLAVDLGLSVVPPMQDGTKRPYADVQVYDEGRAKYRWTWDPYQTTPATREHVLGWYQGGNRTGIGVACGVKDLELFEFDDESTYREFKHVAVELGLDELVEWVESGYLERSPGGGIHWLWYCDPKRPSMKLACRPSRTEPGKVDTLIETKGDGGYAIIAPSNGKVHETGGSYVLLRGGLDTIRSIGPTDRNLLDELARSFDLMPERKVNGKFARKASNRSSDSGGLSVGDDFAERTTWAEILEPHGWVAVCQVGDVTLWRRPGKPKGWSATTGHCKGLKVFSTSTPFSTEGTHTKLGAYAVLNHQGDIKAAVKSLAEKGFGEWVDDGGEVHKNPRPKGAKSSFTLVAPAADPNSKPSAETGNDRPIIGRNKLWVSCLHNSLIWLKEQGHDKRTRYDSFRQRVSVNGKPLDDELVIELTAELERCKRVGWAQEHVRSAILAIAHRNEHSSLCDWLDSLRWDETERVGQFFAEAYGCPRTDYTAACASVLFLSAIARAFQPGCQADVMVVLIGNQGIGKSMGIASLCPDPSWYADDLGCDLFDRKAGEGLRGKWMIEFSEFNRINRATLDVAKAFISRKVDYYRPAYGRTHKDFPRTCIFVGTTNDPHPLHDMENRRFMPVQCVQADVEWIAENRDQLWAEAMHLYRTGAKWWVTDPTLASTIASEQADAKQSDFWEAILEDALGHRSQITMKDATAALEIPKDKVDRSTQTRIGLALKAVGYVRQRARKGDDRHYVWVKKPASPWKVVAT